MYTEKINVNIDVLSIVNRDGYLIMPDKNMCKRFQFFFFIPTIYAYFLFTFKIAERFHGF